MLTRRLELRSSALVSLAIACTPVVHTPPSPATSGRELAPGVTHSQFNDPRGPWAINLVQVDLKRSNIEIRAVRALDQLKGRERVSEMAGRVSTTGVRVLAAVNADFFNLESGENENNQVIAGEWWKGLKVTDSPYDIYDNTHIREGSARGRRGSEQGEVRISGEHVSRVTHPAQCNRRLYGSADAGIRGAVSDLQRGDLERIKRSQHHLLSLINDILNFAKIEAGRVRFDLRDVTPNETFSQLETLIAPQLQEKGLRYEYVCHASGTVHVDPERVQQIMLNLLSNAIKFTPAGGQINIACRDNGQMVEVQVTDTGVGIPAEKIEHIFEPFVQLDRGQTAATAGTGLGLAISRDLTRAMGGDLSATSKIDAGSTFTLTLPRGSARS